MNKKIERSIKVYPWYSGLTADLLFYIAVDTLFLTLVKNFSAAEIVSLTSISQLVCIALQFPILFVIRKIGNTASVRFAAFLMLLSAIFITFGDSYMLVLLGRILHDASTVFKSSSTVSLGNNLDMLGRRRDFVRVRTSANTVYAVITMIISFIASFMFNFNNYLPMICCITTCTIGFVLSIFVKDYSDYNKIDYKKADKKKVKINYSKVIILTFISYALFYTLVNSGQTEGKLFIQEHLLLNFNKDNTSLILGAILCVSRIIRVISNLAFAKLYDRYEEKMGVALPVMLAISAASLLFGSMIPSLWVKIIVMAFGYTIILFARDPFNLFIQDAIIQNSPKEQHQTLITLVGFGTKIMQAGTGLIFSAILLSYPMSIVIAIILVLTVVEIVISGFLVSAIIKAKKSAETV